MLNFTQIFLVFLSALTTIVGDSIVKRISADKTFFAVLKDPWMLLVYLLYFSQIIFSVYIFIYKGDLAIYSNFYIVFYGIMGTIFGIIFFKEGLNWVQVLGIAMAIVGAILMNHKS